jgi:hypothetical protein
MIDYKRAVSDMMADPKLAVCFYTKQQCLELRQAIIESVGPNYGKLCGHIYPGHDCDNMAFRLECESGMWQVNGGNHSTYSSPNRYNWYKRFINEYEIPDEEEDLRPVSLSLLFGGEL